MATWRIPIDLQNPRITSLSGNCFPDVVALANIDKFMWKFVLDVDGKLYGQVQVPSNLAGTPAAAIVLVIGANDTSGVTRLNVATKSLSTDGESYNATLTSDTAQDITVPATARLTKEVTFTVGDLANIAANDLLLVEILHEGSHANDTLAVNTELVAAYFRVDLT